MIDKLYFLAAVNSYGRMAFGLGNPNYAAAVFVSLLPFLWIIYEHPVFWKHRNLIVMVGSIEVILIYFISITASRGGEISLLASIIYFSIINTRCNQVTNESKPVRRFWTMLVARLIVVAACYFVTKMHMRFNLIAHDDKSMLNRMQLWIGGLRLIHASPLVGWGKGMSGISYMQWLQATGSTLTYRGMVNSYLHIAVEFGLPVFSIFVGLSSINFWPFIGSRHTNAVPPVIIACSTSFFSFLVSNLFSTMWMLPSVGFTAYLAWIIVVIYLFFKSPKAHFNRFIATFILSLCLSATIYSISCAISNSDAIHLSRSANGSVTLSRSNSAKRHSFAVLIDSCTLGSNYGKELRASLLTPETSATDITIFPPNVIIPKDSSFQILFAFGSRVSEVSSQSNASHKYGIFPKISPRPGTNYCYDAILLSEHDEFGVSDQWRDKAHANSIRLITVAGADGNLGGIWPIIYRKYLLADNFKVATHE